MREALRKVSTGFKLVYYGLIIRILAVVLAIVAAVALGAAVAGGAAGGGAAGGGAAGGGAAGGAGAGFAGGAMAIALLFVGMTVIGTIIGLVGRFHCLAIPDEAGSAKPMIVTSVVLEVISLLITLVNAADDLGARFIPAQIKMVMNGLGGIFGLVAAILFLLFIRSAAEYVRRPRLGDKAMSVLWLCVAVVGLFIAAGVVMVAGVAAAGAAGGGAGAGAGAAAGGCLGGILILVAGIVALVALIKYAKLLTEMSAATLRFADRMGDYEDEEDEDEREDEEDEDDRPRRRSRRDEVDEDEDDRPRRKRRDDDEDEDDRPRKKKRDDDW
jgi:hypothetical protein